jgi:hypothetical protein
MAEMISKNNCSAKALLDTGCLIGERRSNQAVYNQGNAPYYYQHYYM